MPPDPDETLTFVPKETASEDSPNPVAIEQAAATFGRAPKERYERRRVLGRGGMGTVVLVHDHNVGRSVALKELNEDAKDDDALARFAREARVQGQLEHPAIVPVYDVGTNANGKPYFTMKRVRGKSLAQVLAERAAGNEAGYSRRKLLSAFSQLCAAVHYAHERGVIHRDIKPTNIMLGPYGEVYLLDWGVAKIAGETVAGEAPTSDPKVDPGVDADVEAKVGVGAAADITGLGTIMGSLVTMAPEQAVGGEVDARADVYALGAVLFEILTGEPFHPRDEASEVIAKIIAGIEARPSVRVPNADVPPELEELCVKATKLHPADRLPSAMALRDAIEAYLDGDRDLELRREGARKHAEAARRAADEALRPRDGKDGADGAKEEAMRAQALGEVGKALALDPSNKEALATLVDLLTKPPAVTPAEVAAENAADVRKNIRRGGIAGAVLYGYISLNGVGTWMLGVNDERIFATAHVLWALAFVAGVVTALRPSYPALFVMFLLGLGTSTYITSVYGPYLIVSTLIAAHGVLFAFVRDWPLRIAIIVLSAVAWTISVFGEALGLFPTTVRFVDGGIQIRSVVIDFPTTSTTIYLYTSVLAGIVLPALVVGALRSAYHRTELAMRVQSWQLRRLVSDGSARDPRG